MILQCVCLCQVAFVLTFWVSFPFFLFPFGSLYVLRWADKLCIDRTLPKQYLLEFFLFLALFVCCRFVHLADRFPFKFVLHDSYGLYETNNCVPLHLLLLFVSAGAAAIHLCVCMLKIGCCDVQLHTYLLNYGFVCKFSSSSVGFSPIKLIIRFLFWHRIKRRCRWQRLTSPVVQFRTHTNKTESIRKNKLCGGCCCCARRISQPWLFNEKRLVRRSVESDHIK